MPTAPSIRSRAAIVALCAGLFPLAVATYTHLGEDAFITFRYVEQFVSGHGLVFNWGERVEGFSNPLWVAMLSPFAWLGGALDFWARVLSIAFLALLVAASWRHTHVGDESSMSRSVRWMLPLAIALNPFLNYHRDQGLETLSYLALQSAMAFLLVEKRPIAAGIAAALVAWSRPEGLAFAVALWPLAAADARSAWKSEGGFGPGVRRLAAFIAIPVAAFLVMELGRRVYYDSWVPNTVRAKRHGADGWREIARLVATWWSLPVVALAGAAAAALRGVHRRLAAATILQLLAAAAFQLKIGDLTAVGFRYLAPAIVPTLVGLWLIPVQLERSSRRFATAAGVGLFGLSLWPLFVWNHAYIVGIRNDDPRTRLPVRVWRAVAEGRVADCWKWYFAEPLLLNADAGRWVARELAPAHPGAFFAADQLGMLGYYMPRGTHIVDMLGLMDRHVATYSLSGTALGGYLRERNVQFVVLYTYGDHPWVPEGEIDRAVVEALRPSVEDPPGSDAYAPWYLLRSRNEAEGVEFVVYGPRESAPGSPEVVTLGATTEEFLRAWDVTPPDEVPPPPGIEVRVRRSPAGS